MDFGINKQKNELFFSLFSLVLALVLVGRLYRPCIGISSPASEAASDGQDALMGSYLSPCFIPRNALPFYYWP